MRIIAGSLRGRKLADCTKFKDLSPTSDKNREMVFSILNWGPFRIRNLKHVKQFKRIIHVQI